MIRLKNVSKYYYSKGMIASGISKVNLELEMGEFVVITGESGSGKSTLLNVISGLDSYEDGEMYIEGRETSHYLASDFEKYRKKYIGNIFQKFNLVNSYTVYQNIELPLLINGYSKKEIREKVKDIIRKVGLEQFENKKVSKLSGGQMQRVAIARALAKDTDIIVADEPTGNLDSESAEGIVRLLHEISKNKLVIVVTHNYEQFEQYATRKIKMHDGKIAEDEKFEKKKPAEGETPEATEVPEHAEAEGKPETAEAELVFQPVSAATDKNLTAGSKLRLGVRNAFNLFYKFVLLLIVFMFVVFAVTAEYSSYMNQKAESEKLGYNDYFSNYSENRIVLKKADGLQFTHEDIEKIRSVDNIKSVAPDDILLDSTIFIENDEIYYDAFPKLASDFDGELIRGRMPEKDNEVILAGYADNYYFAEGTDVELLDKTFDISSDGNSSMKITVVGLSHKPEEANYYVYGGDIFISDEMMNDLRTSAYSTGSDIIIDINGKKQYGSVWGGMYSLAVSDKVAKGTLAVPEDINGFYATKYSEGRAAGKKIEISIRNIFYDESVTLKVASVYNKKNFQSFTGQKDFDDKNGTFYMNAADYDTLFGQGNYQTTVYTADVKMMKETMDQLENMGYTTLPLKDMRIFYNDGITSIVQAPIAVAIILALFFIAYFVIRLILKSRTGYFSILRMLGAARKGIRRIMDVELILIANIAFAVFTGFIAAIKTQLINVEYLNTLAAYVDIKGIAILYVIIMIMAYLISGKFSRSLFKKTALGTFRGEE